MNTFRLGLSRARSKKIVRKSDLENLLRDVSGSLVVTEVADEKTWMA